jgi:hypothetical protein
MMLLFDTFFAQVTWLNGIASTKGTGDHQFDSRQDIRL